MPGSVRDALHDVNGAITPTVLPFSLCTKLVESRQWPVRMNEYHDGTTERMALVATARRSWQVSKRLAPNELMALRSYLATHRNDAFYIYVLKETVPAFTWDPTGSAVAGRYLVRSVGDWDQTMYIPRGDVSAAFVEVA